MPPLHGAIAFPQMHDVAVMIGDDLHFDVARQLDVLFQVDAGITKGGLRLGLRLLDGAFQYQVVRGHAHAPSAAAGRSLDQHRKANLVGDLDGVALVVDQPFAPRHAGDASGPGQLASFVLIP